MIKIILIVWLIAVHAFAALAIWDTDLPYRIDRKLGTNLLNPPEITHFYQNMLGSHLDLDGSVQTGSTIFLGDSLTQALNVSAISNRSINYGIGMDTSLGLLQRIPQYESLNRASTIVIGIGINDLIRVKRSPEAILLNYKKILNSLPAGVKVIMQSVFPVDERIGFVGTNEKVLRINTLLKSLADEQGHQFVEMYEQLADDLGNLQAQFHIGDGLHLSTEGYTQWIQVLKHAYFRR